MADTEADEVAHSRATDAERRRLRWQFFGSLVLLGLLFGLMLGRLVDRQPTLQGLAARDGGLVLHLSGQADIRDEHRAGVYVVLIEARASGETKRGQLELGGQPVNWQLRETEAGLSLRLIAARPLTGRWHGEATDDGWQLRIEVEPAR
ncbi:hypothetical protein [Stutzerimonas urumqiensis]|uniref:hypothetical protein n=1 Tax=Stutzerimonas urumqiensis TaxID=638269 RepID=UPI000EAFBEEF|nr:hypothetical protein [Stutzerimonas urumqiensis]